MENLTSPTADEGVRAGAEPLLIDVQCVASLCGISTEHARRLADAGRCPAPVRLGNSVRWVRARMVEWVNDGCPDCRGGAR